MALLSSVHYFKPRLALGPVLLTSRHQIKCVVYALITPNSGQS